MRSLIAILLLPAVHGQTLPGVDPRLPEAPVIESLPAVRGSGGAADDGEVLADKLHRIILISPGEENAADVGPGLSASEAVVLPSPHTLASRLNPWLERPLTSGGLAALADEILIHYDGEGFPVVAVEAPEQDLSKGSLRLIIEIGRYGDVGVSRPKHGDPAWVQKGLLLRKGDLVRRSEIDEQMAWYGRSIFRRPRLFVSPGLEPATADLLIAFEEKRPWRVTTGYENSGPDLLGRDRFLLGVAGVTPKDHLIAWQSVIGLPASSLWANALRWEIPFHGNHQLLQLDAAYAKVASRYISNGIPVDSTGSSWAFTAMQKVPLPGFDGWRQTLGAGLEVKGTDQFLLFDSFNSLSPGEVVFIQGKLSHEMTRAWEKGGASFESSLLAAPGGIGGNNSDAAFRAYDPRASASYLIGRVRGEAQLSDAHLLPAEQFAAGGYQSVRGVAEREYVGDNGWQTSLELYSPLISPRKGVAFRVLTFFDYAGLENVGDSSTSLSGTGLGIRLKMTDRVDLRLDHGWRLDETENRSHFGVNFTF